MKSRLRAVALSALLVAAASPVLAQGANQGASPASTAASRSLSRRASPANTRGGKAFSSSSTA